jgi:pyridoxine 5-phosphate synthase
MIRIEAKVPEGRGARYDGAVPQVRIGALREPMPRLHVNVDHIATLREARRESIPDPVAWALAAEKAGAQGITCHLRKDRRHIQDEDVRRLRAQLATRLNLETSLEREIVAFARKIRPHAVCIVPENRQEVTTEGGLDVVAERRRLLRAIPELAGVGAEVSLFVDPDLRQIRAASEVGALFVELHTGRYANAHGTRRRHELARLRTAAVFAHEHGLRVNAGHGLDYDNVRPVAALPHVEELNIGFAIVARSLDVGVHQAVHHMAVLVRGHHAARSGGGGR